MTEKVDESDDEIPTQKVKPLELVEKDEEEKVAPQRKSDRKRTRTDMQDYTNGDEFDSSDSEADVGNGMDEIRLRIYHIFSSIEQLSKN